MPFEKNTPEFRRGAYEAWTYVLNYLNTLDTKVVEKKTIYSEIMKFRPEDIG